MGVFTTQRTCHSRRRKNYSRRQMLRGNSRTVLSAAISRILPSYPVFFHETFALIFIHISNFTRGKLLIWWHSGIDMHATVVLCFSAVWWRNSVVRTSLFGQWSFPDSCPIYDWWVISRVKYLLWVGELGQLSLSFLLGR